MLYLLPTGSILKGLSIQSSLKDTATAKCTPTIQVLVSAHKSGIYLLIFSSWVGFYFLPLYINITTIIYSKAKYDSPQKENVTSHQMLPLWHVYLLILTYLDSGARTAGQRGDLEASKRQCVIYGLTTGPCTAVPFLKKGRKRR